MTPRTIRKPLRAIKGACETKFVGDLTRDLIRLPNTLIHHFCCTHEISIDRLVADGPTFVRVPLAVSPGKPEAVRVLVEEGKAALEATDCEGQGPLYVRLDADQINIALYLAKSGACLEAKTKAGKTPLSMCDKPLADALQEAASSKRLPGEEGMEE